VRTGKPFPTQWVESGPEISSADFTVVMRKVAFIPAPQGDTPDFRV
jgi:hypothetical protein